MLLASYRQAELHLHGQAFLKKVLLHAVLEVPQVLVLTMV